MRLPKKRIDKSKNTETDMIEMITREGGVEVKKNTVSLICKWVSVLVVETSFCADNFGPFHVWLQSFKHRFKFWLRFKWLSVVSHGRVSLCTVFLPFIMFSFGGMLS